MHLFGFEFTFKATRAKVCITKSKHDLQIFIYNFFFIQKIITFRDKMLIDLSTLNNNVGKSLHWIGNKKDSKVTKLATLIKYLNSESRSALPLLKRIFSPALTELVNLVQPGVLLAIFFHFFDGLTHQNLLSLHGLLVGLAVKIMVQDYDNKLPNL